MSNPFASPSGQDFGQGPSDPFGMTSFTPDPKAQGSQGSTGQMLQDHDLQDKDFLDIQVTAQYHVENLFTTGLQIILETMLLTCGEIVY